MRLSYGSDFDLAHIVGFITKKIPRWEIFLSPPQHFFSSPQYYSTVAMGKNVAVGTKTIKIRYF